MVAPLFDDALVASLFSLPISTTAFSNPVVPKPNAGATPESTVALTRLLIENHKRFHVFFNDKGFRNHLSHHLFAAYGIGAPVHVLQRTFDDHSSYQRLAYQSPDIITINNWTKHLGNEDFYNAYLSFFGTEIKRHGLPATFEKYVFSHEANWGSDEPRMLDRFLSGLFHPMIHFGHAPEFGVEGMAVEGLAQTAVHKSLLQSLFDSDFFADLDKTTSLISPLAESLPSFGSVMKQNAHERVHSFTILALILKDDRLKAVAASDHMELNARCKEVLIKVGSIIREYASLWTIHEDANEIQERVEELNWFVTLVFGVGGWKQGKPFRADFVFVHMVTSNIFLPSTLSLLQPKHQIEFMRAYFASALAWFVVQGCPPLDIRDFFRSVTIDPKPTPDSSSLATKDLGGNAWYTILTHTIHHPDVHQVKAARALARSAASYGTRTKGCFAHTELADAEEIDGTLFIRTGGLLMEALSWNYEMKERVGGVDEGSGWDFAGLIR